MKNSIFTYLNSLCEHDHICHLYQYDSECFEIASNFFLHGVKNNDKCVFISERPAPPGLLNRLKAHAGQKGSGKVYEEVLLNDLKKETNKAEACIEKIKTKIDEIQKECTVLLRILMMHSDNFHFLSDSERLRKRACLNKLCLENPIILLTQFQVDRISSKDILSIFKTHPIIVESNNVHKSPLYVEPEIILEEFENKEDNFETLSSKERKVLRLIINGLSNSGIASELSISIKTVETHRANIMKKLDIHNLVDLVKFSMRNGFS